MSSVRSNNEEVEDVIPDDDDDDDEEEDDDDNDDTDEEDHGAAREVEEGEENPAESAPTRHSYLDILDDSDISIDNDEDNATLNLPCWSDSIEGIDDPRRMQITDGERENAMYIKKFIGGLAALDDISDFMCVQLAIIEGDNYISSIKRVKVLQEYREHLSITDTKEDAMRCFEATIDLAPGMLLDLRLDNSTNRYHFVQSHRKFDTKKLDTEDKRLMIARALMYYLHVAFCPDFYAVREGIVMHKECNDADWRPTLSFFRRYSLEGVRAYPFRFSAIYAYHNGLFFNMLISMIKKISPKRLLDKLHFGCQSDEYLDDMFLRPSKEAAKQRLLAQLEDVLDRRYRNERSFSL